MPKNNKKTSLPPKVKIRDKSEKKPQATSTQIFSGKYVYAIGRRKRAIAKVRLYKGKGEIIVNSRKMMHYFPEVGLQEVILQPLRLANVEKTYNISVMTRGGGYRGQADAVQLGIARALVTASPDLRLTLKKVGLLRRDSRKIERKKYGLKGARRAPQFSKR